MDEVRSLKILEKYKEFFAELLAKNIMTNNPIVLKKENTIREAQQIMKLKKISGVPIVDDNKRLVNIITMEDLLKAMEMGMIDSQISSLGDKKIVTFREEDDFQTIIEFIAVYSFGRYPVIDDNNCVLGIITKQDLLFAVVSKLSVLYLHDERRKKVLDSPLSILIKNSFDKNEPSFLHEINNQDVNSAGEGSALLKTFLKNKKFDEKLIRKISIATYEAEVNVVIHGGGVGKIIANIDNESIVVFVEDCGPGIEDVEKAMKPGFSTAPDYIRSLGFGAGMGLPNIKRYADKLVITSEKNNGVKVEMLFWTKEEKSS